MLIYTPKNLMLMSCNSATQLAKSAVMNRVDAAGGWLMDYQRDNGSPVTCVHPLLWRIAFEACGLVSLNETITVMHWAAVDKRDARRNCPWLLSTISPVNKFSILIDPQCQLSCCSGSPWETGFLESNLDSNKKNNWASSPLTPFESSRCQPHWARVFRMNRDLDNDLIRGKRVDF